MHCWNWLQTGGLQRDVVFLCWPIAPSYMSPSARGGGVAGSQPISTAVHRSPNKLWRSNSIFNLWLQRIRVLVWLEDYHSLKATMLLWLLPQAPQAQSWWTACSLPRSGRRQPASPPICNGKLMSISIVQFTVKRAKRFIRPQPGCYLPNFPWPGIWGRENQKPFFNSVV